MRPITFIVCAAGEGQRVKAISENIPKPLLVLNNKTLLDWSLDSLDLGVNDQLIIVHRFDFEVDQILHELNAKYPFVEIYFLKIDKLTSGQAETAFLAKNTILHRSIAIFNADTFFKSNSLRSIISEDIYDGIIPCFKTGGNSWSFCKTDEINSVHVVTQVAEKVRISDWCSVGYYYFKDKEDFFESYTQGLKTSSSTERYIAPLYNQLISKGKNIRNVPCDIFKPMGTPEQIFDFWGLTTAEIKLMNLANILGQKVIKPD